MTSCSPCAISKSNEAAALTLARSKYSKSTVASVREKVKHKEKKKEIKKVRESERLTCVCAFSFVLALLLN